VDISRADGGLSHATEFRARYGIAPDRLVVTQASWMIAEKGVHDLLAAARQVVAAEPRAHFVFAGEGRDKDLFMRRACDLGISSCVTFTGSVGDPLAEGLFAASDVVCQVSRWEEVFGYVIAEAMATSRPVVGTRVGGIPELVRDGETGFLVERGDVDSMAARILTLLRDKDLRLRMGVAGRKVAVEEFNHKINVAQILDLYRI
jgi:glycosyltransferase involved in cell wall biosynthesis